MIGIDIGGANLKVVDENGAHIHYCPLWKETPIREILNGYSSADNAAVVMSGELADCFASKQEGIEFICAAVRDIFPDAIFYGTDGQFHTRPVSNLAAANWLVMADVLRHQYPTSLLVDMGSTTTDVIPLNAWETLKGQTDFTRLKNSLLLYYGLLRTPVSSLVRSVDLDGTAVRVSTEYFACSGDAHTLLGLITPKQYTTAAPDGCSPSRDHCMRRMARMVCADVEEIGEDRVLQIARTYVSEEQEIIIHAVRDVQDRYGCTGILTVGVGSRLLASWLDAHDLAYEMGSVADAMPAWAVREAGLRIV
ncbi:MAG TPA: hydantoinase/oxoprolinase family protein [Methanospirillum sp.]|uniref:hydantoinase/oxoprolinase family protein n=1 Tax=Methanospirillum sp. TaxID=45200 RepID=UPI002C07DB02|nr:hydantoinase/oxoprolinase family protein [Methanospirillum sp.]HOJ97028.1 hydantoinase/oxoprolinase family protein [Methanospirillum sp.]HOL40604.1 hydantoinase/oxoprolinase family protein [Methanospirillum sp.]